MEVHLYEWLILAAIIIVLITIDIVGHVRTPHAPTIKEAAWWSVGYVGLALAFGLYLWAIHGSDFAGQYVAGWATEKALSIDNLFVFVIIMGAFRVPREYQQKALLSGIIIALLLRLVFILVGAAIIERFSWVFYIFGVWLLWTAYSQARAGVGGIEEEDEEAEYRENAFTRLVRKVLPVSDGFEGQRFLYRHGGKTYVTPLLLCVIALGSADIMFAFDSIPAIFGLTQEPYIVFAANAFALLGLRQLYFLIDGLLSRLVYLHYGLAIILGFIGVKLILHALHENSLPFLNGGEGFNVPDIGIAASLSVIVGTIALTVIASLIASKRRAKAALPTQDETSAAEKKS
ncbi:TerC family protein [Actinomycetaceae bacterium MB13-C1-2]|nr:TerC family protein [Actinomycetaceae bacterium MB13-C1-2]